jgi:hypothetical protein
MYTLVLPAQNNKQDSTSSKKQKDFFKNIKIRKTFDGSVEENKPASFNLFENHKSSNDFFNVDIALKIIEFELLEDSDMTLTLYPVAEWHKSTNEEDEKDKLNFGLNSEYYFGIDWKLKPYILSNFVFKRNLLDNINEVKYVGQLSFFSTETGYPGAKWVFDDKTTLKGIWYPYIGYEYNEIPDLITEGSTESFSLIFIRIHLEYWFLPNTIQLVFNGVYKNTLNTSDELKSDLPLGDVSLNYYPGKQDKVSIGIDYQNGYDPDAKFQQIEVTSLSLKIKL